jgi:hypothetical protein
MADGDEEKKRTDDRDIYLDHLGCSYQRCAVLENKEV